MTRRWPRTECWSVCRQQALLCCSSGRDPSICADPLGQIQAPPLIEVSTMESVGGSTVAQVMTICPLQERIDILQQAEAGASNGQTVAEMVALVNAAVEPLHQDYWDGRRRLGGLTITTR